MQNQVFDNITDIQETIKLLPKNDFKECSRLYRIISCLYAYRLKMSYFIYSGGKLFANKVTFCNRRAGKIFLIDEARKWRVDGLKKKVPDYNVFLDLGYNCSESYCRHSLDFISLEAADYLNSSPIKPPQKDDFFKESEIEFFLNYANNVKKKISNTID